MAVTAVPKVSDSQPSPLWVFLNSPFGLWLLGSIVLALVTWGFGYFSSLWTQRTEREVRVSKIYSELSLRFEVAYYEASVRVPPRSRANLSTDDYVHLIEIVLAHANGQRSIAFPEFRNVPATALLSQLQSYIPVKHSTATMLIYWSRYEVRLRAFLDEATHGTPTSAHDTGEVFGVLLYMKKKLTTAIHSKSQLTQGARVRRELAEASAVPLNPRPSVSHVHRMNATKDLPSGKRSFCEGACDVWLRARQSRARQLLTSRSVYSLPASGFGAALPFDQPGPDRGTIQETKLGRPTPSLKRTAEAF